MLATVVIRSFVVVLVLLAFGPCSAQDRRVALVIGVSAYKNVPPLRNPRNDAQAVAEALKRLGFAVDHVSDPDRASLESAIRRFGRTARGAEASVFFFAGHAMEVGGRNWLLPATADIQSANDLRFEAVDLDMVVEQTDGVARASFLFLDACRDNPFRSRIATGNRSAPRGLTRVEPASGTLVAFATAPGQFAADGDGKNSPFTAALVRHIETPGVEVRQLMAQVRADVRRQTGGQQVPWETSALEGAFYFKPAPLVQTPSPEDVFWEGIKDSKDPTEIGVFLRRFPNGVHAAAARKLLEELQRSAQAAVALGSAAEIFALSQSVERAMALRSPNASPDRRNLLAHLYAQARQNKAIAIVPDSAAATWRTASLPSPELAEEIAREACEVHYGNPCVILAVNGSVVTPGAAAPARASFSPRVSYAGVFLPDRIPGVLPSARDRDDIKAYASRADARAIAITALGRLFVSPAGIATQHAAEVRALADCAKDKLDGNRDGTCFLYAVGSEVVLNRRATEPLASRPVPLPVQAQSPAPQPAPQIAGVVVPPVTPPRPPVQPIVGLYPEPAATFRDWQADGSPCTHCPEMAIVPAGSFMFGSPTSESERDGDEGPQRRVAIARAFAVGKFEVTRRQWAAFAGATGRPVERGCVGWNPTSQKFELDSNRSWQAPGFEQQDDHPAVCISWSDAQAYVAWLSTVTGKPYRLLGEAEWEYAARAGTTAARWWGDDAAKACENANVADRSAKRRYAALNIHACDDKATHTAAVGSYRPNRFGLLDMLGNVAERVEDCWNASHADAPTDGSARRTGQCQSRVVRGSSWLYDPQSVRSAARNRSTVDQRAVDIGLRVARGL